MTYPAPFVSDASLSYDADPSGVEPPGLVSRPSVLVRAETLADPWEDRPVIPLNGWLERQRFAPWLTAVLTLVGAFVLFQGIAAVAMVVLIMVEGVPPADLLTILTQALDQYARSLLAGNAVGLYLGLGLPAVLMAWWHTRRPLALLRLRRPDVALALLGLLGWAALVPLVQGLATWSDQLPWPAWVRELEQAQLELLGKVLRQDLGLFFSLFTVALTPALCEELMFRGYVQRQFERSAGVAWSIFLSGFLFGLYHLRLTQLLALSLLGCYMAWLTWRTGSLWIAILVHFANNAFAVLLGVYARAQGMNLDEIEQIELPFLVLLTSLILLVLLVGVLHRVAVGHLRNRAARLAMETNGG